jgi:hypothetical protein
VEQVIYKQARGREGHGDGEPAKASDAVAAEEDDEQDEMGGKQSGP